MTSKPLGQWTASEIANECRKREGCKDCPFEGSNDGYFICSFEQSSPYNWDLTITPRMRFTQQEIEDAKALVPVRHGHWKKERVCSGGYRRYTGIDDMGETHTITVDERMEYDDLYCSVCGAQSADNWRNFCPKCGAIMDGGTK